jgi:hypothetical protein
MTGRLEISSDGRVTGQIAIIYNNPWPTGNSSWGSGAMRGVVMHTMVGNLPGTVATFNDPAPGGDPGRAVSAHFGIAQDGSVHQFGPIGKGWIAWAQAAGNAAWYSIEHADDGNTANPLTDPQLTASAQLTEVLSRFAGFPLQVTDSVTGKGYGTHVMGGAAWAATPAPAQDRGPASARRSSAAPARSARATSPGPATARSPCSR